MLISRRGLITGLVSFVAAPAIVRASSLMPVKAWTSGHMPGMLFNGTITAVCEHQGKWVEGLLMDDGRVLIIHDGICGSKVGDRILLTSV